MMNPIKYIVANIVETLLRGFPFPCKTGLIKIENPDRNSPVFLTCNYHLTVQRVKRALQGMDCYLLVANSRGINVWCAATGGHFTNHDVISVLKTSGIEKLVDHRKVILPQLAAGGIEQKAVQEKIGWHIIWGPVYAKDIPTFIENKYRKTHEISQVRFPPAQRIEMAVMWAFPFSIITALLAVAFWRNMILPLVGLTWLLPFLIYLSFPLYSKWLDPRKKGIGFSKYTVIFDLSRIPLVLWGVFILGLVAYVFAAGVFSWVFFLRWSLISFIIVLLVSIDLMGTTPTFKSGLHEDRFLKIMLDRGKCKGAGFCEQVCPRNCFKVDKTRRIASIPGNDRCVQCGACIVQCPFDALYFINPKGEVISPETIRRFKLNLLGKRLAKLKEK